MKLYIQDSSWMGCIVVVADSEEEARELMSNEENYHEHNPVIEKVIYKGLKFVSHGDL